MTEGSRARWWWRSREGRLDGRRGQDRRGSADGAAAGGPADAAGGGWGGGWPGAWRWGRGAAGGARRCAAMLDRVYGARVALLVGAGNNGGDTLYAGATLAGRGARVDALLLAPDRAHAGGLAAFRAAGGRVHVEPDPALVTAADLLVDGVVGIGGKGALRPPAA